MRRTLRILSVALITTGCVLIVDVGLTLIWKEPISAAYASLQQNEAQGELDDLTEAFLEDAELPASPRDPGEPATPPESTVAQSRKLADAFSDRLKTGSPIGNLRVPSAGIDQVMVEGTDTSSLERGPGHYPATALPGQGSTIGIAGHRTTYGAPFRNIDDIERADEIEVEMPYGTFIYEAEGSKIVEPTATQVVRDIGRERLVLTACHPVYSAAQRYVVFARLKDFTLPGSEGDPLAASGAGQGSGPAHGDSASQS